MGKEIVFAKMEDGVAVMRLDKYIGVPPYSENPLPYIDGPSFASEMEFLKSTGKKIQIRINSVGGTVSHGWDIMDCSAMSDAATHCYGLAASMAGMILLSGKKGERTMDAHASVMLHGPHLADGKKSTYVDIVMAGFKTILESNTEMGAEQINKILTKGDHYFKADEALAAGIVDRVIPSKVNVKMKESASLYEIEQIYASLNNNDMEIKTPEWLKPLFGGNNDAENLTAAMKMKNDLEVLNAEKAKLATEKTILEARVASLEAQVTASKADDNKAKSVILVETAIKEGKIKEDAKQTLVEAAMKDFGTVETMLKSIAPQKTMSVMASIKDQKGADMNYEELAINHPDMLLKIAEDQPELFNRLADEHNKSSRK